MATTTNWRSGAYHCATLPRNLWWDDYCDEQCLLALRHPKYYKTPPPSLDDKPLSQIGKIILALETHPHGCSCYLCFEDFHDHPDVVNHVERQGNMCSTPPSPKAWIVWNPNDVLLGYQIRFQNTSGEVYQVGWTIGHAGRFVLDLRPITGDALSPLDPYYYFCASAYIGRSYVSRWDLLHPPGAMPAIVQQGLKGPVERQGNSTTNIYGNDNRVTTDVGANGWTPTTNTTVGDGSMTSSSDTTHGQMGGSSTTKSKSSGDSTSAGSSSRRTYTKWWEGSAARALDRAVDATFDGLGHGAKILKDKAMASRGQTTRLYALPPGTSSNSSSSGFGPTGGQTPFTSFAAVPSGTSAGANVAPGTVATMAGDSMQHGNTDIQTQAPHSHVVAYPPTDPIPLPNPDLPSEPGASGDRSWLVDTITWEQSMGYGWFLTGKNGIPVGPRPTFPPTPDPGLGNTWPFPYTLLWAYPNCVWSQMYHNHSYWNAGVRVQVTVNGSQFHAGALVLIAFPENHQIPSLPQPEGANPAGVYVLPYAILNLTTGNTASLEVPFISPTPNASTSFLHSPWRFCLMVLSPLVPPTGSPTELSVQLFFAPLNSRFYGLRYPTQQHLKFREVPGTGAFGTSVAGQEIPICGVNTAQPPTDYLPGQVFNWLEFAARPGLLDTLTWTMADDPGTLLLQFPVAPISFSHGSAPIGFVLSLFSQWRGEINLELLFTGCAQHYGRLVVCYTPPATRAPTTMEEAMHGTYTVWDINGSSTLVFSIPFISQSYWKTIDFDVGNGLLSDNGFVSIWVYNQLTGPSSAPPSALVQGFILASDNFQVRLQQNPALSLTPQSDPQTAGTEVPAATATIEAGEPTNEVTPRTTFEHAQPPPEDPDTLLINFFSFYRWFGLTSDGSDLEVAPNVWHQLPLDPTKFFGSTVSTLISVFTFLAADVRMTFRIRNVDGVARSLVFAYVPPGATVPSVLTLEQLSNYTVIDQPISTGASEDISMSFPYASPQNALVTCFDGYETVDGTNYGHLHSNTWGTLIFGFIGEGDPLYMSAWIAFGNFRAWVPRITPSLGASVNLASALTPANYLSLKQIPRPRPRNRGVVRRQKNSSTPFYQDSLDPVWIIQKKHPTYTHWALRSGDKQISLSRRGLKAVIDYETLSGTLFKPAPPSSWSMALQMIGQEYHDYSAVNNCTDFISTLTGVDLPNTGHSLTAACFLAGAGSIIGATILGAQSGKVERQGLGDLSRVVDAVSSGSASVERAAETLSATVDRLRLADSASSIERAASQMSMSIDRAAEVVNSFGSVFAPPTGSPIAGILSKLFSWVAKVFAILLIIFSSPNPMSITGVVMLILADVAPLMVNRFSTNPIAAAFYAVARALGFNPQPEDAEQVSAERQSLQDFNGSVLALKNTEWLLSKVFDLLNRLLKWLGVLATEDPSSKLASKHDDIVELYSDSVAVLSSPRVSTTNVERNLELAKSLVGVATGASSHVHTSLLSQAIRNYNTFLGHPKNPGPRPEPLVVYIYGAPGSGKSVLATLLAATLATKLGEGPKDFFSPSSLDCKFYDGYDGQPVHLIDDIGQDPEGNDWKEFVNVVSTAPFTVPMANLEAKGRSYTSSVIICTSNFGGPNGRSARALSALERRLHIRLECSSDGQLDVATALHPDGPETRHFTSDCPFLRLESINLKFDQRSQHFCNLEHVDDLVNLILDCVRQRSCNFSFYSNLIKKQGITSSTQTELDALVESNAPAKVIVDKSGYTKPLVVSAAFLSIVSSIAQIFFIAYCMTKSKNPVNEQSAYTPVPAKRTKPPPPKVELRSVRRQNFDPALYSISDSVVSIRTFNGTKVVGSMSATFLSGRRGVTAAHLFYDEYTHVELDGTLYEKADVPLKFHGELAFFSYPGRERKSTLRFVKPSSYASGFLVSATQRGVTYVRFSDATRHDVDIPDVFTSVGAIRYKSPTFPGLCGSPVVAADPSGYAIVGIHCAGVTGYSGFAAPLSPSVIDSVFTLDASTQSLLEPGPPLEPVFVPRSSSLIPSPCMGAFPITKEPSVMRRNDPRASDDVDKVAFSKHNQGDVTKPWPNLVEAFDLYFSKLPDSFDPISVHEAVNGSQYLEPIDMHQSPGYPWNARGISRARLFSGPPGQRTPVPQLMEEVDRLLDPDTCSYVYTTNLKDELRPVQKVHDAKTRLIEAAPIQAIIAGRVIFGGLFSYFHSRPCENGSAVGCRPEVHWSKIFWDFSSYPFVYDLDYKNFDASVPTACFELLAEHLSARIRHPAVKPYIMTITRSIHVFGKRSYIMQGGMPSGCVGTSIFNSIINTCCILSAMMSHPEFDPTSYHIVTYGDDALFASNPPVSASMVAAFYSQHTPFKVTPPSKSGDFNEETTIYDVSFLKRWFEPDERFPYFIHPVIDPDTYEQGVMWTRKGEFQSAVYSFCYLAFHSGPNNYSRWVEKARKKAAEHGVDIHFLPYSVLQAEWLRLVGG
uniref:Genome polyprotein n=1 Tax=Grey squirrel kobuvirus TaxID=2730968 RepID=A0A6M3VXP1_9PICO|nr:polyprotein [Grey squirrel kobuvirus]